MADDTVREPVDVDLGTPQGAAVFEKMDDGTLVSVPPEPSSKYEPKLVAHEDKSGTMVSVPPGDAPDLEDPKFVKVKDEVGSEVVTSVPPQATKEELEALGAVGDAETPAGDKGEDLDEKAAADEKKAEKKSSSKK